MTRSIPKLLVSFFTVLAGLMVMTEAVSAADRFLTYVSVSGEGRIARYELDPQSGRLTEAGSDDVGGAPGSLAFGPRQRYLYAALRDRDSVATLRVDPSDGSLTPVAITPVFANPVYVTLDRTGAYLLMSSYGGNRAGLYPIGSDRTVNPKASQIVETLKNPHSIMVDASNRYVFVPNTGSHSVLQYRLDLEHGKFVPNDPPLLNTADGSGPRHFTFHPSGRFVFFVNETDSSVTACALDDHGRLSILQTLSTLPDGFSGENSCADIHITPSGRFLYASNRGHDSLARYSVDAKSGKLTSLGQTPTEKTPREFDIDPTGRCVVAAGQSSGKLATYLIDADTGQLERIGTHAVGKSPAWVSIVRFDK